MKIINNLSSRAHEWSNNTKHLRQKRRYICISGCTRPALILNNMWLDCRRHLYIHNKSALLLSHAAVRNEHIHYYIFPNVGQCCSVMWMFTTLFTYTCKGRNIKWKVKWRPLDIKIRHLNFVSLIATAQHNRIHMNNTWTPLSLASILCTR